MNAGKTYMPVPAQPKIYHIVHMDRLPGIAKENGLWCMTEVEKRSLAGTSIGLRQVKASRARELLVSCHQGLMVGECVPFNFCPRSVMLYMIYRANYPGLDYKGGETPIVHLEADYHQVVHWAEINGKRWAVTPTNAGSRYSDFFATPEGLTALKWHCIDTRRFSGSAIDPMIKDYKQAEFLLESFFPWELVERIGIHPKTNALAVSDVLAGCKHRPSIEVMKDWYYVDV